MIGRMRICIITSESSTLIWNSITRLSIHSILHWICNPITRSVNNPIQRIYLSEQLNVKSIDPSLNWRGPVFSQTRREKALITLLCYNYCFAWGLGRPSHITDPWDVSAVGSRNHGRDSFSQWKTHARFDRRGDLRAEEAVLLHIPRILSMGLWRLGGAHLLSKCVWSAREKSLRHGWELNPGHEENRQGNTFILPLCYHDPGHEENWQCNTFILPLCYHDPGHKENRQCNTFILPLCYHDPGHEENRQCNTFILPLCYHDRLTL